MAFETEWTADRIEENRFINQVRERVALWRKGGYVGITRTTARLLEYWQGPDRERKLFFCQIEAIPVVLNREIQAIAELFQAHPDVAGVGMFDDIADRLLDNAE